jgi:hypothetical protein
VVRLSVLFLFFSIALQAQNITHVEYFFDIDPGFGNATAITVTPGATAEVDFPVNMSALTSGMHVLYVRAKNSSGMWGQTHAAVVFKGSGNPAVLSNISRIEYFINTDPGEGNGIPISFTPGNNVQDIALNISASSLPENTHRLFIRARDQRGVWSMVHVSNFFVCNSTPTTTSPATAITASGFTANWNFVAGATNYLLDVSTDNFKTFLTGNNERSVIGNSFSVTGLTQATAYQYRVRAVTGCGSIYSNITNVTTLVSTPSSQPTNLQFANPTQNSFTVSFTAASGTPTGYLIIRRAGSSPTFVPESNVTYSVGQTVGDGVVVRISNTTTFIDNLPTPGTTWHYDIFSYNQVGAFTSYRTTTPLEGSFYTQAIEPVAQPTNLVFNAVTSTTIQASFTPAAGNPENYLVLRKVGSAPTFIPVDGTTYTLNSTQGDSRVVSVGAATSFSETGLSATTNYHYSIYSFNGSGLPINYRITSPLTGNVTTPITEPIAQPTNLTFSNITSNSIRVAFNAATGNPAGYLVLRKANESSAFVPQPNTSYSTGQQVTTGVFVASYGTAINFIDSGLTPTTTYYYDVFSFNQTGALISYRIASPLEGSAGTFTGEPTSQPSGLSFINITTSSLRLTFNASNPTAGGYLIIRNTNSATTFTPVDGNDYSIGQNVTGGIVVAKSNSTQFDDTGLLPGIVYHYTVFAFNGNGTSSNYLTTITAGNTGSKITVPGKPTINSASDIQQTSFTARWQATTGAENYRLDVSADNFITNIPGFNNLTVPLTSLLVNGLQPGVVYKYRMRAINESGVSENSNETQVTTLAPTPVLNTLSNVSQFGFDVSWPLVSSATSYEVDVSDNNFSGFIIGYNKLSTTENSVTIMGLTPGRIYQTRVRAVNDGGISPSSLPKEILLIPATPLAQDATNTTSTTFKAKWSESASSTEYRIDVSLAINNFSPSLTEYTNRAITGNIEEIVSGLSPATSYRYRVRAVNATGTSPNSNVINVSTLESGIGNSLQLSSLVHSNSIGIENEKVKVEITSGTGPFTVTFLHRKINNTIYSPLIPVAVTGTTYEATIASEMVDEIGVEFFFRVTDGNGVSRESQLGRMFVRIPDSGIQIPFTRHGGALSSYELFSIPYNLNDNLIASIFDEMGEYKKSEWRLVRYQGDRNVDFGNGINRIELGKGYWFNRKKDIAIFINSGTINQVSSEVPASIRLESGWNQIGNPLPLGLRWSEILSSNNNPQDVGELSIYNAATTQLVLSDNLDVWGGGFVFSGNPITLNVPIHLGESAGGRKESYPGRIQATDLTHKSWFIPININQGDLNNTSTGFGMNEYAENENDWFDKLIPPAWGATLEMYVPHPFYHNQKFSRDIVKPAETFVWNYVFETSESDKVILSWDKTLINTSEATVILVHKNKGILIDMREVNEYLFYPTSNDKFDVLFWSKNKSSYETTFVSSPYPNPAKSQTTLSLLILEPQHISVEILDQFGRHTSQFSSHLLSSGYHSFQLSLKNNLGENINPGVYLLIVTTKGEKIVKRLIVL